jgi:hypothetical protein
VIVLVSHPGDEHATAVRTALEERKVRHYLLDTSQFPIHSSLSIRYSGIGKPDAGSFLYRNGAGGAVSLNDARVVWWRRPMPFTLHDEVADPTHRTFAHNEITEAVSGLWHCLDAAWINPPDRDEVASHKVYQLKVAQSVGLPIPETLVTNDPAEARGFAARHGCERTIYKSFLALETAWRETRLLRPEELGLLDNVRFAPVIFQEYIPADIDLRITVIGRRIFAAAVHSQNTSYKVDYRMEMNNTTIEPHRLPPAVEHKLFDLMQRLGLVYGAIDLRRRPDGTYVFLEINTSGQWLFIEERTGQPITQAFVDALIEQATS